MIAFSELMIESSKSFLEIDLGDDEAIYKISILKEFQNTVQNKRSLNDYSYIYLTIDNQIIVREQ